MLSGATGVFAEPAAAAAVAGYLECARRGEIAEGESVVLLITGSGLKDPDAVSELIDLRPPVPPAPEEVERALANRLP
jgi:threonine synthase